MKGAHHALVFAAGAVLTAAVAVVRLMPVPDSFQIAGIAAATAAAAGLIGAWLVHALRRRSLGTQATVACLTTVAAVALGSAVTARGMFISSRDFDTILVVLTASGAVGVVVALFLGDRLSMAARLLGSAARRIGAGETVQLETALPEELASLARELEYTSRRLTESRRREDALESSRRELIAWVSHDLRTPLAGIKAMAEALEDGIVEDDDTVNRYHHGMGVEAGRLAALVENLFELSQIHAGTLRLHKEPVMLGDIVSDSVSGAAGVARAKGVAVEGRMNDEPPGLDLATPEMARVLRNLLDNAIRHTPAGGAVMVETGVDDNHAYVSVRDQCGGIPEEDLARVFEVAFRGEAARTPGADGGTGLGLAIARGIIDAHGGRITVANEQEGCRFTVLLPLQGRNQ